MSAEDLCYFYTEETAFCDSFGGTGRNRGVEMRSEKFARATVRSVTDMCQNVSSTKYFVAGSQTYKSALIPIRVLFDLCTESGNVFGSKVLFEQTAVVSRLPPPPEHANCL
jgi:hypothetical protein